jgi:flavin reductase (DIM6/NTAB) family NADH-FMN oxidoreductase RutF
MSTTSYEVEPDTRVDEFKSIFRDFPAGVAIVTADAGDGPVALVASSVSSLSADPPQLVFSVSATASSASALEKAETVVVHFFGTSGLDVLKLVAQSGTDRFGDQTRWGRLETGEPLFAGTQSWLRGEVVQRLRAASATLHVVHILETGRSVSDQPHRPLVYQNRTWHELGAHSRVSG